MKTFVLVDASNLFHRCKFVTKGDIDIKTGMAIHIMLNSLKKICNKFEVDHVVMCLDNKSWRRNIYKNYKKHRRDKQKLQSKKDKEEQEIFQESFNEFITFCKEKTNVTVLGEDALEADDIISGWVNHHSNDFHIILSGDTDFIQLLSNNVIIYDGVKEQTIKIDGYYDKDDEPIVDKKTKSFKKPKDPEYELFRGDATDGIFSACPRVREKKIKDAFDDRHRQGYAWNNLMLNEWIDAQNIKHIVKDDYILNKTLIDLKAQPNDIKEKINNLIKNNCYKKNIKQVGIWFLSFCEEWDLQMLKKHPEKVAKILQLDYPY